MEGTPFGRYQLKELLGRGGMGEVWRAHDTITDRVVAVKVLPTQFGDNAEFQQRFRREAHAAARLNTPHVVPIYDYGEIEGRLFVCMRLIEGRDLHTVLSEGPMEPARAVRIIEGVAKALHAAHEVGLVHRDVKPSNILLDRDDFAYLIDFGIARAADETRLTKSGNAIGTFQYIAPERLSTQAVEDARADIYSLACVLYECLTGRPPFGGDMAGLVAAHLTDPPPQPSTSQPNIPKQVDQVIATGMAKDPDQRYATTVELADAAHDAITTPLAPPSKPTLLGDAPPATPTPAPTLLDPTRPAPAPARRDYRVPPPPLIDHSPDLFGQATAALDRGDRAGAIYVFRQVVALGHPRWAPLAKEKLDQLGQPLGALPREAYTSWTRRVGAAIIDAIPPLIVYGIVYGILSGIVRATPSCVADTYGAQSCTTTTTILGLHLTVGGKIAVVLIGWLPILAVAIWNWGYRQGTTGSSIGKSVLKFKVVNEKTGKPIGFGRSIVRQIAHVVDTWTCYIGYLFPIWDAKRQTLADKIMSTVCLPV